MNPHPYEGLDPRAFRVIPDGKKKKTKDERKAEAKQKRDELMEKYNNPKGQENAG